MALVLDGGANTITNLVINSANITDGSIVNADINASAAIASSKISGSLGKILQVVSATKTDHFSTTSSSLTEITGLNVTITPSATTSKIYLVIDISVGGETSYICFNIKRDSTLIAVTTGVDGNDSRHQGTFGQTVSGNSTLSHSGFNFLDTPSTTSAITYKVFTVSTYNTNPVSINRAHATGNAQYNAGGSSTITAVEVGA